MQLTSVKKAHFIGIGGVGMSATAKLLKAKGIEVTGSDEAVYEPMRSYLAHEGLPCSTPYRAENIPTDVDVIVIGKNAKLVPETNTEVAAAYASGKPTVSYPEVLAALGEGKETVAVVGSYGKSTSTALLSHCLLEAGKDPAYWIPAVSFTPAENAHIGSGKYFVVEGDEYPSSNTDPRSKFLHYRPAHVLVTPLAHDHVNVFPTPESYVQPFIELVGITSGIKVICADGVLSADLLAHTPSAVTYGLAQGTYQAANIAWGERTSFDITKNGSVVIRIETSLLGEHNVQNIVGVVALVLTLNALTPEQLAKAVASFKGIKRRLDKKTEKARIPVYEGFGSSYEKARSAIAAIKLHFPTKQLVIVFEPHTFTWRNRATLQQYDDVFAGARKIYIFEPAEQGSTTHAQLTQEEILARVRTAGFDAEPLRSADIPLTEDDVVLILTSGDLGGLMEPLIKTVEHKFPA
jgi:UDP-N-acetylmuramate: L-alanyl-gamma-D-glutamyl-meso-diaminopimelate ligase